jgi:hypothetical protein
MSARPGRIVETVRVDLPVVASRRETVTHPAFVALREHVMSIPTTFPRSARRPGGDAE